MNSFAKKTNAEMVALYGEVMSELYERGIVRSGNNPVADMAERVIADYYGVEPEPPNQKSYDVVTRDGTKVQVKGLRRIKASRKGLSPLHTLDFDILAAVIFERDMSLVEALFIPLDVVRDYMGWSKTWKANRISITNKLMGDPRVKHVPAAELVA